MQLLTKAICRAMPELKATEEIEGPDKIVQVKYFTPDSNWTWYVVEANVIDQDGHEHPLTFFDDLDSQVKAGEITPLLAALAVKDVLFFGYVEGMFREWGYFALSELKRVRGPMGLPIERDLYQDPAPLREIRPDIFS